MIIDIEFEELEQSFDMSFDDNVVVKVVSEHETYDGEYSITPKLEAQTLPTKKKVMSDDIKVEAVPVYETSNNSGGTTVYIVKE